MLRRMVGTFTFVVLAASAVQAADEKRAEFGVFLGNTSSEGISSNDVAPSGSAKVYVEARPKNAFSWGVDLNYFLNDKFEIGALYSIEKSELQFTVGTAFRQVGQGLDVQNMMGTFIFNTGDLKSKTRFYLLGGLGATRYGNVTLKTVNGRDAQIDGRSKFATTWGAGVKFLPSPKFGMKAQIRWTPTNIKDTADEWLCSPYLPASCTVTGVNHQYSNQLEYTAGAFLRF